VTRRHLPCGEEGREEGRGCGKPDSGNPETHNNSVITAKGGKDAWIDAWINASRRTHRLYLQSGAIKFTGEKRGKG